MDSRSFPRRPAGRAGHDDRVVGHERAQPAHRGEGGFRFAVEEPGQGRCDRDDRIAGEEHLLGRQPDEEIAVGLREAEVQDVHAPAAEVESHVGTVVQQDLRGLRLELVHAGVAPEVRHHEGDVLREVTLDVVLGGDMLHHRRALGEELVPYEWSP